MLSVVNSYLGVNLYKEAVRFLPTNRVGELLRVVFEAANQKVSAALLNQEGRITEIKPWDLPKDFRKITNIAHFNAYFSEAYASVGCMNNGDCSLRISQRVKGGAPDDELDEDLATITMQRMAAGIERIRNTEIDPNVVLLIGRVGAGKSTFGNILCNYPIEGAQNDDGQLCFESTDDSPFTVSSSTNVAGTKFPAIHTAGRCTVVDLPGFGDPAGPYDEIVNAFYRKAITDKARNIKVILVVEYDDIWDRERSVDLERTLNDLIAFLGCCRDEEGLERAASSISLLVTKVAPPDEGESDEARKEEVKNAIEQRLEPDSPLPNSAKALLRHVMEGERWSIFSSPENEGDCPRANAEGRRMKRIVANGSTAIRTVDADIQARVSSDYSGRVIMTIKSLIQELKQKFAPLLLRQIDQYIQAKYESGAIEEFLGLQRKLQSIAQDAAAPFLTFVQNVNTHIPLTDICMAAAARHHLPLEFLTGQLPPEDITDSIASVRTWLQTLRLDAEITARAAMINALAAPAVPTFTDHVISLRSYFPRTSQINALLRDASVSKVEKVIIYGLHEVIVDEDLDDEKLGGANVTIVAPHWNIVNNRKIVISGIDATEKYKHAADKGNEELTNGKHGSPGFPGKSGGHFFGLAQDGTGFDRLKVISNGGTGGEGQEGGAGHAGKDGKDGHDETRPKHEGGVWEEVGEIGATPDQRHTNKGTPADPGGDGGRGGAGGKGGNKGSAALIVLSNPAIVLNTELTPGEKGRDGAAGRPGPGGTHGHDWEGVWNHHDKHWHPVYGLKHKENAVENARPGNRPKEVNSEDRKSADTIPPIDIALTLLGFKAYFITHGNFFAGPSYDTFVQQFEGDQRVKAHASTAHFLDECNGIEEIYTAIADKKRCLPLYRSVLGRINDYIESAKPSDEDIVKLQQLCALILSKICQINGGSSPRLVIDIRGYLQGVMGSINQLVKLNKAEAIRVYEGQFENEMKAKIQEADGFINLLAKDIQALHNDITLQVRDLVDEVRAMVRRGLEDSAQCRKQQAELKSVMAKKSILAGVSIAIQCIGSCIYPPAGAIAAGVISAGIKFAFEPTVTNGVIQGGTIANNIAQINLTIESLDSSNVPREVRDNLVRLRGISIAAGAVVQEGMQTQQALQQGNQGLAALDDRIRQLDASIQNLHNYQARIPTVIDTPLRDLVEKAGKFQRELQNRSMIARDYDRLFIKRIFESSKQAMRLSTQGFAAGDSFVAIIQQMQEALETSMNIYDRVQDYEDRIRLAGYMANLANPVSGVQDRALDALRFKVQYNIVLEQYGRLISALRQWAFPFGLSFLQDVIRLERFAEAASIGDIITQISSEVQRLSLRVDNHYNELNASIHGPRRKNTYLNIEQSSPFYVWKGRDRRDVLAALLRGQEVLLHADVRRSTPGHGAIKFNEIALTLHSDDETLQAQLSRALQSYELKLHHSGQSYYRYADQVYRIDSNGSFYISYSFARRPDNVPIDRNDMYTEMKKGNMMLSPYTYWRVKLAPRRQQQQGNLLDHFRDRLNDIEIHLLGEGEYVREEDATGLVLDPSYAALKQYNQTGV